MRLALSKKFSLLILGLSLAVNFLSVGLVFGQTNLSGVTLTVSPTTGVVNETSFTFRISGAPANSSFCITDTLDPSGCSSTGTSIGSNGVGVFSGKEDTVGTHNYGVKIEGNEAPNAKATVTVTAASSTGGKALGESCTQDSQCSSGTCDPEASICSSSGVIIDTGGGSCDRVNNTGCPSGKRCDPEAGVCVNDTNPGGGGTGGGGGGGGGNANCNNDPNLKWDATAKICIPAGQPCTTGSLACEGTLSGLLLKIINYLLIFAGMIAVLFIVIGGFWYLTSAGNEEQSEKGKKALLNAVIGLVVISLAFLIVRVVANTLNTNNILN